MEEKFRSLSQSRRSEFNQNSQRLAVSSDAFTNVRYRSTISTTGHNNNTNDLLLGSSEDKKKGSAR